MNICVTEHHPGRYTIFTVTWTIEIDATSHEEAAREAFSMMQDPATTSTFFEVTDEHGKKKLVDVFNIE